MTKNIMLYNDDHRYFLRTVASYGVISMSESIRKMRTFKGSNTVSPDTIKDLVSVVNNEIRKLHQNIKIVEDKNTEQCDLYLIFIANASDNAAKVQNIFSDEELISFKTLLNQIMHSDNMHFQCYKTFRFDTCTKKETKSLLDKWCDMQYIQKISKTQIPEISKKHGRQSINEELIYYTLGLRGIHEFEKYINVTFPNQIKICTVCHEIVLKGCFCKSCDNLLLHTSCLLTHRTKEHDGPRTPRTDEESLILEGDTSMGSDSSETLFIE